MRFCISAIGNSKNRAEFSTNDFDGVNSISVGRSATALLSLKHFEWVGRSVGRTHFSLVRQANSWLAVQNGEDHFLVRDGEKLAKLQLTQGVCFIFGDCQFEVLDEEAGSENPPRNDLFLLVKHGDGSKERIELYNGDTLKIGKSKESDLVLDDRYCSREHARISLDQIKCTYSDESTNGSMVDGEKIHQKSVDIKPGDVISIGQTTLTLQNQSENSGDKSGKKALYLLPLVFLGILFAAVVAINSPSKNATPPHPPKEESTTTLSKNCIAWCEEQNLKIPAKSDTEKLMHVKEAWQFFEQANDNLKDWKLTIKSFEKQLLHRRTTRFSSLLRQLECLKDTLTDFEEEKSFKNNQVLADIGFTQEYISTLDGYKARLGRLEKIIELRTKIQADTNEEKLYNKLIIALENVSIPKADELAEVYLAKKKLSAVDRGFEELMTQLNQNVIPENLTMKIKDIQTELDSLPAKLDDEDRKKRDFMDERLDRLRELNSSFEIITKSNINLFDTASIAEFDQHKNYLLNSQFSCFAQIAAEAVHSYFSAVEKAIGSLEKEKDTTNWRMADKCEQLRECIAQITCNLDGVWKKRNECDQELKNISQKIRQNIDKACVQLWDEYHKNGYDKTPLKKIIELAEPGSRWYKAAKRKL